MMTVKNSSPTRVQQKLKDILAVLDETGKPYFITQRNRPKAVVIRYEDYSALVEQAGDASHGDEIRCAKIQISSTCPQPVGLRTRSVARAI